jgi:hypothetical protein
MDWNVERNSCTSEVVGITDEDHGQVPVKATTTASGRYHRSSIREQLVLQ